MRAESRTPLLLCKRAVSARLPLFRDCRTAVFRWHRDSENLVIIKTAGSAFEGYIQDSLTTLPQTVDRLFGTAVRANWRYKTADLAFAKLRAKIRAIVLAVFAGHASKSVQHTLYAMGEAVLQGVAEVDEIDLIMPNMHCLLVDLSRFGQDNPNEIFVPVNEPSGYIEACVRRNGTSSWAG